MSAGGAIDRLVYRTPEPRAVARLWESHGQSAVAARYHWLNGKMLAELLQRGRIELGLHVPKPGGRKSSVPDDVAQAAFAAAGVLGSGYAAEIAAGVPDNAIYRIARARGIPWIQAPKEVRARNTADGNLAAAGDAEARARIEARRAHARAVFDVFRAALALAPPQADLGRPRLPEPSPALSAALAGHDPAAVLAVFPDMEI